ncbi:oxidoreductase-like protein [Pisolithus sp. B1]|nr:oxidoreductase-like protein [Pisolithus sp. B1]
MFTTQHGIPLRLIPRDLRLLRSRFPSRAKSTSNDTSAPSAAPVAGGRPRRPQRGGQNLTERYRRLENSIQGKNVLTRATYDISRDSASTAELQTSHNSSGSGASANTIAGFVIPEEPKPPADDECCMSGCAICVYDLYEESLNTYKESVASLRASLTALSIPESQWPSSIRTTTTQSSTAVTQKDVVLSAFEEMERALKERREKRAAVEADSQSVSPWPAR